MRPSHVQPFGKWKNPKGTVFALTGTSAGFTVRKVAAGLEGYVTACPAPISTGCAGQAMIDTWLVGTPGCGDGGGDPRAKTAGPSPVRASDRKTRTGEGVSFP